MVGQPESDPGSGEEFHLHEAVVQSHEHYHISHHHRDNMVLGEWSHRASSHSHLHNHTALEHSHDYDIDDETREHEHEAHVHDHESPADSPA